MLKKNLKRQKCKKMHTQVALYSRYTVDILRYTAYSEHNTKS